MSLKRILVADTPEGQYRVNEALSELYELKFASTLREAKQQLIDTEQRRHVLFDLVIAGMHFDESRMIDLLQYIRSFDHFDQMPMLVIQAAPSVTSILEHSAKSAQILGACGYVELVDMPEESANKRLQQAVKESFDKPVAVERIDKGANPHIPVSRTP